MKCVRCGHDSKKKERTGRTCPGCHKDFAFDPNSGDPLSDGAFQAAIAKVSSDGEVWWGVEHLYYQVARRLHRKRRMMSFTFLVGLFVGGVLGAITHWVLGAAVFLATAAFSLHAAFARTSPLSRETFEALWQRWLNAHGSPRRLITRKKPAALAAPRHLDADIPSYSFDRAVICDRARTVDLLLTNNFHFENNCAVLSLDGYPHQTFEIVRGMLKNNPRLQVYALHDATPAGAALAHHVAHDPAWFGGRVTVVDVGLAPRHARAFRGLWIQRVPVPLDGPAHATLRADERRWLAAGWSLELAAIPPEQVIKRLYRALAHDRSALAHGDSGSSGGDGGGGVIFYGDGPGMDADASASDGGGDSFG